MEEGLVRQSVGQFRVQVQSDPEAVPASVPGSFALVALGLVGGCRGRKNLAGTMLRAPMSLEKMSCDAQTGTVIYRSKMHLGLKAASPPLGS